MREVRRVRSEMPPRRNRKTIREGNVMEKLVNIKINGMDVSVPQGTAIIEAAKLLNI